MPVIRIRVYFHKNSQKSTLRAQTWLSEFFFKIFLHTVREICPLSINSEYVHKKKNK